MRRLSQLSCGLWLLGSLLFLTGGYLIAADDPTSNVIPSIRTSGYTVHELNRMSGRVGWESAAVLGGTKLVCLVVTVDDFTPETRAALKAALLNVNGVSRAAVAFRGQVPPANLLPADSEYRLRLQAQVGVEDTTVVEPEPEP